MERPMTATGEQTKAAAGELRRPTLALHLAERNRLRAERATRLARLRAATPRAPASTAASTSAADANADVDVGAGAPPDVAAPDVAPPDAAPSNAMPPDSMTAASGPEASASEARAAALEALLRDLAGAPEPAAPAAAVAAAEILHFARGADPARAAAPRAPDLDGGLGGELGGDPGGDLDDDLGRLPGAGPGLVAMLRRERLDSLAAVAALTPAALAARLGPAGRLVPLETWIDTARQATAGARPS